MLILSASNVAPTKEDSRSLRIARLVAESLESEKGISSEVIDLRDYRISPCVMCMGCAETGRCVQDDDFNALYARWLSHDRAIFIVPHYAGVPSKLVAATEKMQELYYLAYCLGKATALGKDVALVAHGGMTGDCTATYTANILNPLSFMLKNIGCEIRNEKISLPLCFAVSQYHADKDSFGICFRKDDDDETAARVIDALVASY
jgi:multimeric flavodoxin WrbA